MSLLLSAPQPLVASNIISEFDCGEASLDGWLKRRDMPDPIPVLILARLAVDRRAQGIKLGAGLLRDAVNRAESVAQNAGVRALVVHALNEKARAFYEYYGFSISPIHPLTLMLRLN